MERFIAEGMIDGIEYSLEKNNIKLESFDVTVTGNKFYEWTVKFNNKFKVQNYYDAKEFDFLGCDKDLVIKLIEQGLEELKNERS